ncbi:acyloxyacyl hydrolase [Chelatococcus sp. SYSU_G07232]|uniref:Acyloxyacyl hydrolase n=1 Tax=Chelatococcus albus TaxID=3047466 RepID=A0ABT7AKQ4_9HYPH|nr:acyloxyacyl hydrolase [Chelatococcus sp. SYSU_G07232]MDJ1159562.1 acyloxyacyl hydrolase [Chelatococcus sp. SYSU_G07232]
MRSSATILATLVFCAFAAGPAGAADLARPRAPSAPPPTVTAPSFLSELRFGVNAHDPWSPEKGSADITGEILFAKPFTASTPTLDLLIPRLHIGGALNTAGKTSHAYAGFTWTFDLTQEFFVEASLGGAVHNGKDGPVVPADHNAMGCSPTFRESAAIGWRLTANWSVMATVEHLSNAGICDQNRGLTNIGAKVGYRF